MVITILNPGCSYFGLFWRLLFYNQHLSNFQEHVMIFKSINKFLWKSYLNERNKVRKVHKIKTTNRRRSYPSCMLTSQDFCPVKPLNGLSLGTNIRVRAWFWVIVGNFPVLPVCKCTLNCRWSFPALNFIYLNMTKTGKKNWRYQTSTGQRAKFVNPLTAEWVLIALIDFTLSDARRFYSSMGNPLAGKGLRKTKAER